MSLLDPDVVYEDTNLPDHAGEIYHGHDGVARAAARWVEPFETVSLELEQILGTGDLLMSVSRFRAKARHSGIELDELVAYVWTFRAGKVIHFQSYRAIADALQAAGLQEDALRIDAD